MSFFEVMGRLFRGETPFVAEQPPDQDGVAKPQQSAARPTQPGPKVTPRLTIGWSQSRINGTQMTCECDIRNDSQEELDLDKVQVLGVTRDLGTILSPGKLRRLTIYNGNRPTTAFDNRGTLNFVTNPDGDYYQVEFLLELQKQTDNTHIINKIRQLHTEDI